MTSQSVMGFMGFRAAARIKSSTLSRSALTLPLSGSVRGHAAFTGGSAVILKLIAQQ